MSIMKYYGLTLILVGVLICTGCSNQNEVAEKEKAFHELEVQVAEKESAFHELEVEVEQLKKDNASLETTVRANDSELDRLKDSVSRDDEKNESSEAFWEGYEDKLAGASTLEAIFDLYTPRLDGAYSEGYCATLYDLFVQYGEKEFVTKLAAVEDHSEIGDIISCLTSEMDQLYYYGEEQNLENYKNNLMVLATENDRTNREKQICYQLLADIEWIEQYGKDFL